MTANLQSTATRRPGLVVLYAALAIVGTVLTYLYFIPFLMAHGLDLGQFLALSTNSTVATMLTLDVLGSSLVFWVFMAVDAPRHGIRAWPLFILPNLLVGLLCALPLYLLVRELRLRSAA